MTYYNVLKLLFKDTVSRVARDPIRSFNLLTALSRCRKEVVKMKILLSIFIFCNRFLALSFMENENLLNLMENVC